MSIITDTWRQLVQRRLWPVAVLLLAALVAVPVVLAAEPAPSASSPAPQPSRVLAGPGEPLVTLATAQSADARRRRVLGARKDPFAPAPARASNGPGEALASAPEAVPTPTAAGPLSAPTGPGPVTSTPSPSSGAVPAPPTAPAEPKAPPLEPGALTVRFGDAAADALETSTLNPGEALASLADATMAYVGLTDGGRTAVFIVDASIRADGDGKCEPDPTSCEEIHLRVGDTEFLDVLGEDGAPTAQYRLDLVRIEPKK